MPGMPQLPLNLPAACKRSTPALLALSGGRDSVALLHALLEAGFTKLVLCHLNHGLRGRESGSDALFVRRLAQRLSLPCEIEKADVAALAAERRLSLETAAREERHAFLLRMAEKHDAWVVFMAHHAEDQAETVLANLCRGCGSGGLGGMRRVQRLATGLHLVRPLLQVRRHEIDAWLKARRLKFREDSSNTSPKHRRNRLRHEALPLLGDIFMRDVVPLITRHSELSGRDDEYLSATALAILSSPSVLNEDKSLPLTQKLTALHPALLSRVIACWLREVLGLSGIDHDLIEAALGMLSAHGASKVNLPHNRHLRRKAKRLWVE